ncbi:MAG: hypothetical protein AB1430_07475 [Pseudomonadota bacterium]
MHPLPALLALAAFIAVHLLIGRMRFLRAIPRSRWLSAAGGVSVAYVFLQLLPELHQGQRVLAGASPVRAFAEHHAYLVALAGLSAFYGLERLAVSSRRHRGAQGTGTTSTGVFWLHIGAFASYNALVGYLLAQREDHGPRDLALYALAMALHFVVADHGLREHHRDRYDRIGRWLLGAAAALGWAAGLSMRVEEALLAVFVAFLSGGIVLNVLKEELPEERESRFSAFLAGASAYALVILMR